MTQAPKLDGSRAYRPKVSVCMATWNGSRYLRPQLDSILEQLGPTDEVVVVDDASADDTAAILREYQAADPRVVVFLDKLNRGSVQTFGLALERAKGEILMLADQDDVWLPGRVDALVSALADTAMVVASNLVTLDGPDSIRGPYPWQSDWRLRAGDSSRRFRNLASLFAGASPYYGCAMAIRSEARLQVLPFPAWLDESHDQWIALWGILTGQLVHLDARTLARRLHDSNLSTPKPRGVSKILHSRLLLVRAWSELRSRIRAIRP